MDTDVHANLPPQPASGQNPPANQKPSGLRRYARHLATGPILVTSNPQTEPLPKNQKHNQQEQSTKMQRQVLQPIPSKQVSAKEKEILKKLSGGKLPLLPNSSSPMVQSRSITPLSRTAMLDIWTTTPLAATTKCTTLNKQIKSLTKDWDIPFRRDQADLDDPKDVHPKAKEKLEQIADPDWQRVGDSPGQET